jgi:hypothetical protein
MWGTIEPGKEAFLYVFGPMFGMTGVDSFRPLFRMESIAAVRTYPQPGGAYRYLAAQIILFTDCATGRRAADLDATPTRTSRVHVFQYRDGPLDYVLDPNKLPARYDVRTGGRPRAQAGARWYFRGETPLGTHRAHQLKNRAGSGRLAAGVRGDTGTFEAYRWQGKIAEIEFSGLPSIPLHRDFQTFKPWEPDADGQRRQDLLSRTAFKIVQLRRRARKVYGLRREAHVQYSYARHRLRQSYKLNDSTSTSSGGRNHDASALHRRAC